MSKDRLFSDPDLAQFYDWDCPWTADFDWFASLVAGTRSVLDLGCGTGVFTAAMACRGADAVGVDAAAAMLDIVRARDGGDRVTWVKGDVRHLALGRRFDAVVMTGHAFQALLTRADRAAVLAVIRRHLEPAGRFFFDSRNPEAQAWLAWTPDATRARRPHPVFGMVERWIDARTKADGDVVSYATRYLLPDGRQFSAQSRIAFPPLAELERLIGEAGLRVDRWAGDAAGGPVAPGCVDLIAIGGVRGAR